LILKDLAVNKNSKRREGEYIDLSKKENLKMKKYLKKFRKT